MFIEFVALFNPTTESVKVMFTVLMLVFELLEGAFMVICGGLFAI